MLPDLICLSHLRWDFVYQRPHHLMTRWQRNARVMFVEEPTWHASGVPRMEIVRRSPVMVVVPRLPESMRAAADEVMQVMLTRFVRAQHFTRYALWYYTPRMLRWTTELVALLTIYDCMDELSAHAHAPPELIEREVELLAKADLVFTGGVSLYESKRGHHPSVRCFPSSIDPEHFTEARDLLGDPPDQANLPRPRLGYFGVIDERMDLELLAAIADARPRWQIVMLGPVVRIDPATLPQRANIHWLGWKPYHTLPAYLANWQVALLPFALNGSTRFISPTKTLEYLAGGKRCVSSPLADVVRPYGETGLVSIATDREEWVEVIERLLTDPFHHRWLANVDAFIGLTSWNDTFTRMRELVLDRLPPERSAAASTMGS